MTEKLTITEYDGLIDRSSTIAVINDGKILLGQRRDNGKFTLPGGGMEPGETAEDCAIRELWEETGIKTSKLTFIAAKRVITPSGTPLMVYAYQLIYDGPTETKNDPDHEVRRWRWIDIRYGDLPKEIEDNLNVPNNFLLKELGIQKSFYIESEFIYIKP